MLSKKIKDDLFLVCERVLSLNNVKYTKTNLKNLLQTHSAYPSLLCIKDTLYEYGINSAAIRKNSHTYDEFELPFICSIQESSWHRAYFTVVLSADNGKMEYIDPLTGEVHNSLFGDFEKIDKHIILLIDAEKKKDEVNFINNRDKEKNINRSKIIPYFFAALPIIVSLAYSYENYSLPLSLINCVFILTSALGIICSLLLIWHEIDSHNPILKEICGGRNKKINCDAVLSSKGATFLTINWSIWGFGYFATFFLFQILYLENLRYQSLWIYTSLAVSPYILYSLIYQWKIVKQWCLICLSVQLLLGINATTSFLYLLNNINININFYSVYIVLLLGGGILAGSSYIISLLKLAKESADYQRKWKRLRFNPDIFNHLLKSNTPINISSANIGLTVGNIHAGNEIIKVCNPYCGPCSRAHPELDNIIKSNPDVKLRIIFTTFGDVSDEVIMPVAHLFAIEKEYGKEVLNNALDEWYASSEKDYISFAKKYPVHGEIMLHKHQILAMKDWCSSMKIRATPTIFINGNELPDEYNVYELKNFFN